MLIERILFSDFVVYASECMYVMILSCMLVIVYYLMMLHVCVGFKYILIVLLRYMNSFLMCMFMLDEQSTV